MDMVVGRIVKSPYFVIYCLFVVILWLLYHPSCPPVLSPTRATGTQFSHIRSESLGLLSLLKRTAADDRHVIITMVDREWAKPESLLDLFLESFKIGERTKHLLNHLIVVALDEEALRHCYVVHPHCYLFQDLRRKSETLNPDGLLDSWRKKALVKEILQLGYHIVFTEADVMWLRNPLMHCDVRRGVSVACGSSSSERESTGGFFYAKSVEITLDLFNLLDLERYVYPETENQSICDIVNRQEVIQGIGIGVHPLDEANFGRFCQPHPLNQTMITTVHASCCNDTRSKVHYLKLLLQDWKTNTLRWQIPSQCI